MHNCSSFAITLMQRMPRRLCTIFLSVSLLFSSAMTLDFSKDTVYETEWKGTKDEVYLRNHDSDSIFIDSLYLRFKEDWVKEAEVAFRADPIRIPFRTGTEIGYQLFYREQYLQQSDRSYPGSSNPVLSIAPASQLKLSFFDVASCLACPVSSSSGSAVKDTTTVYLIFTPRTGQKDTLTLMGIYNQIPSGISPFPSRGGSFRGTSPGLGYNALGRQFPSWEKRHPETRMNIQF